MERYLLAIYVTLNQEQAIKHLFTTNGWKFLKTDVEVSCEHARGGSIVEESNSPSLAPDKPNSENQNVDGAQFRDFETVDILNCNRSGCSCSSSQFEEWTNNNGVSGPETQLACSLPLSDEPSHLQTETESGTYTLAGNSEINDLSMNCSIVEKREVTEVVSHHTSQGPVVSDHSNQGRTSSEETNCNVVTYLNGEVIDPHCVNHDKAADDELQRSSGDAQTDMDIGEAHSTEKINDLNAEKVEHLKDCTVTRAIRHKRRREDNSHLSVSWNDNSTNVDKLRLKNLIAEGKLLSIKNNKMKNKIQKGKIHKENRVRKEVDVSVNKIGNKVCSSGRKSKLKKPVFCAECKVTFTSQKRYDSHRERNGGKCVFECDVCGKIFLYRKSRYDLHMLSAHSTERPYKCEVCGKGYVTSDKLKIHKRIHTGEKPCVCEECGLSFYSRGDLANHREYHHTVNTADVQCEICNMTFCNKRYLAYHKNVTHSNKRDFHCHSCPKSFKTNSCLTRHLKYIHSDLKNFQCTTCDKSFKTAESLKKHQARHIGERTFFCTECNKGFYERAKLVQHYRTHSGERPYKCSLCDYRCALSGNLRKHFKTHTSDKVHVPRSEDSNVQNMCSVYSE